MASDDTPPLSSLSAEKPAADTTAQVDPLLTCLTYLTRHYGRARSPQGILAGLPYDDNNMGPKLFCEAAENIGITTKVKKHRALKSIKPELLPVTITMKDEYALVLMEFLDKKTIKLYDPQSDRIIQRQVSEVQKQFNGYLILTRPGPSFINPETVTHQSPHDQGKGHWFWDVVTQNSGLYTMAILGAIFINCFALVSPLFIMNVYDRVIPNNAIETGWALGIGALSIYGFDMIMRILRAYLIDFAGRRIDIITARRIFDQVLNIRIANKPRSSGVFANMLRDFDSVRDFFTSATITVLVDLPFTLFFLFVIYRLGGVIALALAGLIIAVFIIGLLIQIPLKQTVKKATKSSEAKHGMLIEAIAGLETIKTIGADGLMRARYMSLANENSRHGQTSRFWSGLGVHIASFLQQSASIIAVLIGMYLVRDAQMSMGALIACVILGGRAIAPIGQIAGLMTKYHHAGSALKTIDTIMRQPVDRPEQKTFLQRNDLTGKIALDHVHFSYPQVKNLVLKDISLSINPGEKIAIIGRVGSGKSTIARLLMGLYSPNDGTILFDDTDIRQIDPVDIKKNVAYISQDIVLFSGSVRDNIAMGHPHATEADILAAAKAAGVEEFVSRHPMGYDAPVGEQGQALSGGQKQCIALARAMISQPNILICDEPTNAMDSQSEARFRNYVQAHTQDKTLVMITHKMHMLNMAERIILMDKGKIVMDGPREAVLNALKSGKAEGLQA